MGISLGDALRDSEKRYRALFESMGEGLALHEMIFDAAGSPLDFRFLDVNPAFERLTGLSSDQVIGRTARQVLPGIERAWIEAYGKVVRTGEPVHIEAFAGPLGRYFEVHAYRPADGQFIAVFQDVTERHVAAQALRHERDLLQAVMNGARNSHLVYLDRDFNFVRVNEIYAATCGFRPEEMVGKNHFALYPHPENEAIFARVRDSGEAFEVHDKPFEFPDQPERGVTYWDWTLLPVKDAAGQVEGLVFSLHETTARKRAEEALRHLNESLEGRVAERTMQARNQAVQLRRLTAKLAQVERKERERLAKILHDHLQQLLVAAKLHIAMLGRARPDTVPEITRRTEALLDQAIADARSLTTQLSPPVLHDGGLAAGLGWLARRMLEQHGLRVEVSIGTDAEPADVDVKVFLFEAVRELLFNVVKHAGVPAARVVVERTGDQVRVRVEDEGKGIGPDARLGLDTESGFGLFSIQQRVDLAGGRMMIEGAPGRGTHITIVVPAATASVVAAEPEGALDGAASGDLAGAAPILAGTDVVRVMLADDHRILRQGLAALLREEEDLEIVGEAADGAEAVELARLLLPDVIVMDLTMPKLSGIEATRQIVAEQPGIRVIGLSMHDQDDMATAMLEAGAFGFLTKGGPSDELVMTIRRAGRRPAR